MIRILDIMLKMLQFKILLYLICEFGIIWICKLTFGDLKMTDKEMLNLGCGRCFHKDWINVDYSSCDESVIAYDLTKKLPFEDNSFEVIYHSHLLEHFEKSFAPIFLKECYRVLKKGGIIRI